MGRTIENNNLKPSNLKDIFKDSVDFFKNFSSIFAVEKVEENDLDLINDPLASELQGNLKDIESGKALEPTPIKPRVRKTVRSSTKSSIDTEISNAMNIDENKTVSRLKKSKSIEIERDEY